MGGEGRDKCRLFIVKNTNKPAKTMKTQPIHLNTGNKAQRARQQGGL